MENAIFATTLKALIASRGISQKWLADEAETTEATISRYIAGKNQPEISIVVRVAKALNVSVDYLCGLTDMPNPKESLGVEMHMLMRCYGRADSGDKKVLWTVLERYMTPEEKENPISTSFAMASGKRG